jgi:hypothetical protein
MYRERKRTKTDASVDTEKIKEQIKQEMVAEMQMHNMRCRCGVVTRWCCHQCPIVQALDPPHRRVAVRPQIM